MMFWILVVQVVRYKFPLSGKSTGLHNRLYYHICKVIASRQASKKAPDLIYDDMCIANVCTLRERTSVTDVLHG